MKDPLNHTREDIDSLIAHYREQRKNFKLGDKNAGNPAKTKGPQLGLDVAGLLGLDK